MLVFLPNLGLCCCGTVPIVDLLGFYWGYGGATATYLQYNVGGASGAPKDSVAQEAFSLLIYVRMVVNLLVSWNLPHEPKIYNWVTQRRKVLES